MAGIFSRAAAFTRSPGRQIGPNEEFLTGVHFCGWVLGDNWGQRATSQQSQLVQQNVCVCNVHTVLPD